MTLIDEALVEAVARAINDATCDDLGCDRDDDWQTWVGEARAATAPTRQKICAKGALPRQRHGSRLTRQRAIPLGASSQQSAPCPRTPPMPPETAARSLAAMLDQHRYGHATRAEVERWVDRLAKAIDEWRKP